MTLKSIKPFVLNESARYLADQVLSQGEGAGWAKNVDLLFLYFEVTFENVEIIFDYLISLGGFKKYELENNCIVEEEGKGMVFMKVFGVNYDQIKNIKEYVALLAMREAGSTNLDDAIKELEQSNIQLIGKKVIIGSFEVNLGYLEAKLLRQVLDRKQVSKLDAEKAVYEKEIETRNTRIRDLVREIDKKISPKVGHKFIEMKADMVFLSDS